MPETQPVDQTAADNTRYQEASTRAECRNHLDTLSRSGLMALADLNHIEVAHDSPRLSTLVTRLIVDRWGTDPTVTGPAAL